MEIITITNNYLGQYVNSFVVRTANADIFIDAGLFWNRAAYEPFLRDGRERVCLSTHGHWDHIGMAGVFRSHGARLHGHAGDARFYADFTWHWQYIFGRYEDVVAIPPERAPMFRDSLDAPMEIDVPLVDGQTLAVDGAEFAIIHTPGHSPGSVCIHERNSGALFTGDTLMGRGFFAAAPMYANAGDYLASLRRLREVDAKRVFCCHNPEQTGDDLRRKADEGAAAAAAIGAAVEECVDRRRDGDAPALAELTLAASRACGRPTGPGLCLSTLAHLEGIAREKPWIRDILDRYPLYF